MKNVVLVLILSLIQFIVFAQTVDMQLNLTATENNIRIINANISLSEKYFGSTNKIGKCSLENVSKGNYLLKITHISYEPYEGTN